MMQLNSTVMQLKLMETVCVHVFSFVAFLLTCPDDLLVVQIPRLMKSLAPIKTIILTQLTQWMKMHVFSHIFMNVQRILLYIMKYKTQFSLVLMKGSKCNFLLATKNHCLHLTSNKACNSVVVIKIVIKGDIKIFGHCWSNGAVNWKIRSTAKSMQSKERNGFPCNDLWTACIQHKRQQRHHQLKGSLLRTTFGMPSGIQEAALGDLMNYV